MNTTDSFWEENLSMHPVKYESCNSNDEQQHDRLMKEEPGIHFRYCDGNLNFATAACSEDDSEYGPYHKKNKVSRQDPMSHRIIEKRRRDRMNNCLADLSRLIPADYLKKGRGRIEKTEIIEMAIKHMKYLQQMYNTDRKAVNTEHYRLGFQECMSETMSFLVEVEGFFAREALCVKLLNHLQAHCETLLSSDRFHSGSSVGAPAPNSVAGHSQTSNSTSVRQPSASNGVPDHIDSNSQLRDMLNGGIIKETASEQTSNVPLPVVNECSNSCEPIALTNPSPPNDHRIVSPSNAEKPQLSPASNYLRLKPTQERESYEYLRPNTDHMLQIQHRPGPNNNLYHHTESNNYENVRQLSENELYDKNRECTNGASLYKFKNNINQRFIQDLNAENGSYQILNKLYKRRKTNNNSARRVSSTVENYCYSENHSSSPTDNSQASFQCSEVYTRGGSSESDNTNRISPAGSSVSDNKHISRHSPKSFENYPKHLMHISRSSHEIMKTNGNNAHYGRYSPNMKHSTKTTGERHCQNNSSEKPNFGIPIFVLHTKGSFYIPLTIDYNTLIPYLQNYNILDMLPNVHNIILHPVTINVNFQPNIVANICKQPKYKVEVENGWH